MCCLMIILLPILPAAGWALYHYEIWWGFYIVGGLLLLWGLQDLFFDKSRGLFSMSNWEFDGVKCFANVLSNVVSWVIGWCYTGSFLDGLILGAYISLPAYMAVSGVLTALFGNGRT